jgi:hypothetical protein
VPIARLSEVANAAEPLAGFGSVFRCRDERETAVKRPPGDPAIAPATHDFDCWQPAQRVERGIEPRIHDPLVLCVAEGFEQSDGVGGRRLSFVSVHRRSILPPTDWANAQGRAKRLWNPSHLTTLSGAETLRGGLLSFRTTHSFTSDLAAGSRSPLLTHAELALEAIAAGLRDCRAQSSGVERAVVLGGVEDRLIEVERLLELEHQAQSQWGHSWWRAHERSGR